MTRTLAAIALLAAAPAAADPVAVKVTEVAGGVAYLDAGRAAGIVHGVKVKIGALELVVVDATEKTSSVELGTATVAAGATGIADVTPGAATAVKQLAKPRPAEAFTGQWPAAEVPSATQEAKLVPLGSGRPPGRAHVTMIGHAFGVATADGAAGDGEVRAIASFDLMADRPLSLDADVAARGYTDGANAGARTPLFVRTAQLRYGDLYDPRFALGRLRYAASSLGMLDGARAMVHAGAFAIGAFGGLVPDPISGKPSTDASRFGAEIAYDAPTSAWQPRLSLTGYGSTWNGTLDERRLVAIGAARRGPLWLDGWAEAQQFAADNPWGAHAIELTGAGAVADYRERGKHLALDLTFLRPERSLRLASALPPEWLCTRRPQPGDGLNEACTGGDSWASASVSAGARGAHWSVDAIGAVGRTNGVATVHDSSGYLSGELRWGGRRVLAGVSAGRTSFGAWTAAELGAGVPILHRLSLAARYRPERIDYIASTGATWLHSIVVDAGYAASNALDVAISMLGSTGADRDAAAALVTIVWRPLP